MCFNAINIQKIGRRSLSIVLSLCLVAACLATTALPSNEVRAGLITNVLTGKWGAIAMGTIERGVIFGVSKAKNAAEEDGMYQALRWTQRILAGNSGLVASDTLAAVKKMSAQLNALVSYTMESNGEITDMLNQLETDNYKSSFKTCFDAVDNFGSGYNDILGDFDRFIDAFVDYAEAKNSNPDADVDKSALSRAYSLLIQNYFSSDDTESELFIKPLMGSPTSVAVLSVISPYDRSQEIGSEEDFTDPDRWILANGAGVLSGTTYMETFYNYITRVTNLENNVHDQMRSAANFAADAAYKYTQAYRYYAEFKSMLLAADSTIYDDPYPGGPEFPVAQNSSDMG